MTETTDIQQALFSLTYGLYIVTSHADGKLDGQISDSVFQVSDKPPRVAVVLSRKQLTHEFIEKSGTFAVSVLDTTTPLVFVGLFGFKSGRSVDKLAHAGHRIGITGCPLITEHTLSAFEAKVVEKVDLGTHTLFVGEVLSAEVIRRGEPLTYTYYREHLRGRPEKDEPTYSAKLAVETLVRGERRTGMKYACLVCGYVYDPERGEPENGIKPGTRFEDLPETYVCPVCGVGKKEFEPVPSSSPLGGEAG
jgi:flavin reductase (DIM6/NTAB) family NADH-FMN oxidoreductase RutF/rubredoxin